MRGYFTDEFVLWVVFLLCDGVFHHWIFLYLYFLSRWRWKNRLGVEGFFLFFFFFLFSFSFLFFLFLLLFVFLFLFSLPSGVIVRDLYQKYRLNAMQVKSSDLYEVCQWTRKLHSLSKREGTFILIAWCAVFVELSSLILYKYFSVLLESFFLLFDKSGFNQDDLMLRFGKFGDWLLLYFVISLSYCALIPFLHSLRKDFWITTLIEFAKGPSVGIEPARQWLFHLEGQKSVWECGKCVIHCSVQLYQ